MLVGQVLGKFWPTANFPRHVGPQVPFQGELMRNFSDPESFGRVRRLPPYVFNVTAGLKEAARRRGVGLSRDRHRLLRHPAGCELLQRMGQRAFRGALFGKSDRGVDLYRRRRSGGASTRRRALCDTNIGEHACHQFPAMVGRGDECGAVLRDAHIPRDCAPSLTRNRQPS